MTFPQGNFFPALAGLAGRTILPCIALFTSAALAQNPDWQACNSADQSAAAAKIAGCTRVLDRGERSPRQTAIALGNRALAYTWQKDIDRAIADFSEAIRVDPDFPIWRYARAMQYENKGQHQLALADLNEAIRLRPDTPDYIEAARRVREESSIKAVFEKYNLLGVFAQNCGKPPTAQTPTDDSPQNWWFVNRPVDANHVQRDFMTSASARAFAIVLDNVTESSPNEIRVTGMRDDALPVDMVWRIEPNRTRTWQGVGDTKGQVADGKYVETGNDMPWLTRCDSQ